MWIACCGVCKPGDFVMPAEALLAALDALLQAIGRLKLPSALLGGLALAIWRHPRFTQDVDLLLALGDTSVARLLETLAASGFRPKRGNGLLQLGDVQLLQFIYEPAESFVEVQVDLMLVGTEYQRDALARRVAVEIPGIVRPVDVLACEDVILHKLCAGRIIDRADAAALLRANRDTLDVEYLVRWIGIMNLTDELALVWEEAFPGEQPPGAGD